MTTAIGPQPQSDVDLEKQLLQSHPLFMTSLPEDDDGDGGENVALAALQSLVHDGTPDGGCTARALRPRRR
jgi:hypothetical protein